jgi:hypothetical protein
VQAQRYRDIVTKAIEPMKEWQFGIRSIILLISFEHMLKEERGTYD